MVNINTLQKNVKLITVNDGSFQLLRNIMLKLMFLVMNTLEIIWFLNLNFLITETNSNYLTDIYQCLWLEQIHSDFQLMPWIVILVLKLICLIMELNSLLSLPKILDLSPLQVNGILKIWLFVNGLVTFSGN